MDRRRFLRVVPAAVAGAALAPTAWAGDGRTRWRMVLAWSRDMDLLVRGAFRFAKQVSLLTESRLAIDVSVAPQGAAPRDVLDMVRRGEAQCAHGFAGALEDDEPALAWFDAMPGGLNDRGMTAWMYRMGGQDLLKETASALGMYAWPMGDLGPGALLWSRRRLEAAEDIDGLRVAADGQVARALAEAGAEPVAGLHHGARRADALRRGRVDAALWRGPHMDEAAGFFGAAPHVYDASVLAPGRRALFWVERGAYEALPAVVRKILGAMVREADLAVAADCIAANAASMRRFTSARPRPGELQNAVRSVLVNGAMAAMDGLRDKELLSRKVGKSYVQARSDMTRTGGG